MSSKKSTSKKTTDESTKTQSENTAEKEEKPKQINLSMAKIKQDISKIPTGIEEPENKLKLTTSKLFALTGSLFCIFEGRQLILDTWRSPVWGLTLTSGIISVLVGMFIFVTLNIVDFAYVIKKKLPYEWFILMGFGILVTILNLSSTGSLLTIKGGVLLMIGGLVLLLQGLKSEKSPSILKIISLIGIGIGFYEGIKVGVTQATLWTAWLTTIVIIGLLILFLFTLDIVPGVKLPNPLKFEWWLVLTVGVAMYYLAFQLSGIVIIHVFLLMLIAM